MSTEAAWGTGEGEGERVGRRAAIRRTVAVVVVSSGRWRSDVQCGGLGVGVVVAV